MKTSIRWMLIHTAALIALALVLGTSSVTTAQSPTLTETPNPESLRTQYPVTIKDCGDRETTYDKAPERVITIDPNLTEMLLLLGLKDKIVGYTEFYPPERQWSVTKADMSTLNQINDINVGYPAKETVVALNPDFVGSIYSYAFMDPLPDHDGWAKLGVNSYEAVGECYTAPPTDFTLLYQDLHNLGIIFDVQDRAEAEIKKLQQRVTELQQKAKDAGLKAVRIAPYDGTVEHPPVYGGTINSVIALAGADYIWADADPNTLPSWEQFIAADPDVIWLIPDAGPSVDELKQQIENDARFKDLTAVKNHAYIIVPQADATVESPRLVDGVEQIINALLALQ